MISKDVITEENRDYQFEYISSMIKKGFTSGEVINHENGERGWWELNIIS